MRPSPAQRFSMRAHAPSAIAGTLAGSKRRATLTLSSTCGNFSMPEASSASDRPVCFMMLSTCSAVISPSPVVVRFRHRMWPEVSPPSTPPLSLSLAST